MPASWRIRLTMAVTTPMPASRPMVAAITRTDAFVRIGSRQPRQLAWASALLRVRPVRRHAEEAEDDGDPAGRVRLIQRRLDLRGDGAGDAGVVDVLAETSSAKKPSTPTTKSSSGHEEQEQPEGDGAPDDAPGRLLVALVDAQAEVDERTLPVALEQRDRPRPPGGDAVSTEVDHGVQATVLVGGLSRPHRRRQSTAGRPRGIIPSPRRWPRRSRGRTGTAPGRGRGGRCRRAPRRRRRTRRPAGGRRRPDRGPP